MNRLSISNKYYFGKHGPEIHPAPEAIFNGTPESEGKSRHETSISKPPGQQIAKGIVQFNRLYVPLGTLLFKFFLIALKNNPG